jgi:hypothetical protein
MTIFTRIGMTLSALSLVLAPAAFGYEKGVIKTEPKTPVTHTKNTTVVSKEKTCDGKEVTLTGRVVDLACYMGGMTSKDHCKCTAECLKSGVPAALVTPKGMVMLGKGHKGAGEMLAAHAYREVRVRGKMYEKNGMKYMSIESIESPVVSARHDGKKLAKATTKSDMKVYPAARPAKTSSKATVMAKSKKTDHSRMTGVAMAK